ncbi:MAG: DUF2225 domain-containing protein [Oscillospiraceae bacterium]|nr:DUF2225 domain-containing protein [Oscillospiraceae bacterium]
MTEMEMLRNAGTIEKYGRGQPVFSQYDPGNEMYVVLKGTFGVYINTFTGFTSRVAGITQGSFFGEMAVIDGSPRSASIVSEDEEAFAVKIGKDNFKVLLEKAPNITSSIMITLRNRATATAEAVKKAGKEAPELPAVLSAEECKDANCILCNLTTLAAHIRKMNTILVSEDKPPEPDSAAPAEETSKEPESQDAITLLPEGYKKFNITDKKNNNNTFRVMAVVCPYCRKSLKAYVPIYGCLGEKRETLDGRVIYGNLDILLYTNTICPNCNYSDTYMEYSAPRDASVPPKYEGNQFENAEKFTGYISTLNRTVDEAILSYYLSIDCLKRTSANPLKFANAWIRLYWLYNDRGSNDFAKQAAKNARYYYGKYSEQSGGSMSVDDKLRLGAILGEMSVVLGDYETAFKFYTTNTNIGKGSKNELYQDSIKRCKEIKKLI